VFTDSTHSCHDPVAEGQLRSLPGLSFLPHFIADAGKLPGDHFVDFDDVVERLRDFAIRPRPRSMGMRTGKLPFPERDAAPSAVRRDRASPEKIAGWSFPSHQFRQVPAFTPGTPGTIAKRPGPLQAQPFAGSPSMPLNTDSTS